MYIVCLFIFLPCFSNCDPVIFISGAVGILSRDCSKSELTILSSGFCTMRSWRHRFLVVAQYREAASCSTTHAIFYHEPLQLSISATTVEQSGRNIGKLLRVLHREPRLCGEALSGSTA